MKVTLNYGPAAQQFAQHVQATRARLETHGDNAVRLSLEDAGAQMDETVPVDTTRLAMSRTAAHSPAPLTWATGYPLDYALTLEYGGYPGVGRKTVQLGGGPIGAGFAGGAGIYSKQAPLGWVRRALASVQGTFHARILAAARSSWEGGGTSTPFPQSLPRLGGGGLPDLFDIDLSE
jgi:hypothetical protein